MSVSIVLISHSHELVEGLQKLLEQVQPNVKITSAGGTAEKEIGTSSMKIKEAIEKVYSEDGVAIFFDLGSALMNAELAMDMLDDQRHVKICNAPLVEGAYVATVEAGLGSTLEKVVSASEQVRQFNKIPDK